MKTIKRKTVKIVQWLFLLLGLFLSMSCVQAQEEDIVSYDYDKYIDLDEIQNTLKELKLPDNISFKEMVLRFLKGELPFTASELKNQISQLFLREAKQQKNLAVKILVIVIASAIYSNFIRVFDNSQIADISFYMMYLMISVLLMTAFVSMSSIVENCCRSILDFMKVLLPSYLATLLLTSGSVTAMGFYNISILGMSILELVILRIVLPGIRLYLVLLIMNQMSHEDYFSHFAELVETGIRWGIKTILGLVIGLQVVQNLVTPAVDSLKNSVLHRAAKAIPGIGNALDAAAETVTASAVVLKNAVGVSGIVVLLFLCLIPVVKLTFSIFLFRLLCAFIQPISEKRMVDGIASISQGAAMLLRVLGTGLAIFVISLAMITAAVRGV